MSNAPTTATTEDRFGAIVAVGTVVRIIHISSSVLDALDVDERARVRSMMGNELSVYEVDKWGCAWVEKWWHEDEVHATSHSLGFKPVEMKFVHYTRA